MSCHSESLHSAMVLKRYNDQSDLIEDLEDNYKDRIKSMVEKCEKLTVDNEKLVEENEKLKKDVQLLQGTVARVQNQQRQNQRQQNPRPQDVRLDPGPCNGSGDGRTLTVEENIRRHIEMFEEQQRSRQNGGGRVYRQSLGNDGNNNRQPPRGQRSVSVSNGRNTRDSSVASNRGRPNPNRDNGPMVLTFDDDKTTAGYNIKKILRNAIEENHGKNLADRLLFDRINRLMAYKLNGKWFSFDADVFDPDRASPKHGTECYYNYNGTDHVTYEGI